ncbi:MAG TPA: extracellular solute-binding protein [Chloroflexota bacterium]|nr:extracellular solute-binding protein [Chloroflexota bacterium]
MKNQWLGSATVLLALTLMGCGGAAPASAPATASSAAPATASSAAAKPTVSSAAAKPAGSQAPADWQQTVEAAKKEGTVAVFGPDGTDMRDVLTAPFEKEFGIKVEYIGDPGPGIPPRINAERGAGKFLWDIVVVGTSTGLTALIPSKVLDTMEPALILPDVKDPKTWRGGAMEFLDPDHQMLVMSPFQRGTLFINPKMAKPEDFKSYKDLLDVKWKGKIVLDDPRKSGPGQATFTFFYLHPDLGPSFIKALGQQQMTVVKDFQQEVDMVGQGRFPVLLGGADFVVVARGRQGIPIEVVDPRGLKEGSDVSPANGSVALVNKPPHPNAAKVYLNWLLSKEEQTAFAKVNGYISARVDVPTDHAPAWRVPQPGAIKTYDAQAIAVRDKVLAAAEDAVGK